MMYFFLAVVILVVLILVFNIKIVPQASGYVMERLGAYRRGALACILKSRLSNA